MSEYKFSCGVVRDLLPLYRDNVCGEDSRGIVEEHIAECRECADILERLDDHTVENTLSAEAAAVLENHRKSERRAAAAVGIITAGILLVPVIVCLICNLASGHGLSWFYIVFASLLTAASVTVVPMLSKSYRFSKTVGCFLLSLFLLLLSCCVYTHGSWLWIAWVPTVFGVSVLFAPIVIRNIPLPDMLKNRKTLTVALWDMIWLFAMLGVCCAYSGGRWFATAAIACMLGLSAVLLPIIVRQIPVPKPLRNHKGLLVMLWDTAWLYVLLFDCAKYVGSANLSDYLHNAVWVTALCLIVPWAMLILIRYTKLGVLTKIGACVLLPTLFALAADDMMALIVLPRGSVNAPSPLKNFLAVITGKIPAEPSFVITAIVFSSLIALGALLIILGAALDVKKNKKGK